MRPSKTRSIRSGESARETTMLASRRRTFRFESRKLKIRLSLRDNLIFWSKRRDSNPRSPVPEAILSSLLTTFIYFLVLFSPKTMLSDALVRTVSTQSESVDGQRCGHRANFARLKARKLNRIYPVLSFICVVSIAYFRKLVNIPFPKRKN